MTTFLSSPSPVMTHPANSPAGPSSAGPSGNQATNAVIQSLADLYNVRHAQQSGGSPSKDGSSSSLAALYNQRHEEEKRKDRPFARPEQPSSKSLAELYNQRYETEQQDEEFSPEEIAQLRPIATDSSRSRSLRDSGSSDSTRVRPYNPIIINSDDSATPEATSTAGISLVDAAANSEEEEDGLEVSATPIGRSPTRSESVLLLPDRPEIVFVQRPSIPCRGALGSGRTRLTIDSEDDDTLPRKLPSSSASSAAALSLPHPPLRRLIVDSKTSSALISESDSSIPPIPPHQRKAHIPQHALDSTQEDSSITSMLRIDSATSHQTSISGNDAADEAESVTSDGPMSDHERLGSPDGVIAVSGSSVDAALSMPTPPPLSDGGTPQGQEASTSEPHPWSPTDGDAVVILDTPTKPMRETLAEERGPTLSADESSRLPPVEDRVATLDEDDTPARSRSDSPIITEARLAPAHQPDSSAAATPGDASDSDARRRYPKRARTVKDYNLLHLFEENVLRAYHSDASAQPQHKPRKQKEVLPVVEAPPAFFEAIASRTSQRNGGGVAPSSFAGFLMHKAKASDNEAAPSISTTLATRRTAVPGGILLSEAQAREIASRPPHPAALWDLEVSKDDRGELFKLKSSTRRWLGMPGPNDRSDRNQDESRPGTPPASRAKCTYQIKLSAHHLGRTPSTASLRRALESLEGTGPVGRASDASGLESDARRIRLGRVYKLPLPDPLRILAEMEQKEWLRLEDSIPQLVRMAEEKKAREQGQILVEVDDSDWVKTQVDAAGRKRVTTLRCDTGGTIRLYYRHEEEGTQASEVETPVHKIVRIRSPTKSPSRTRLGSVLPRDNNIEKAAGRMRSAEGKHVIRPSSWAEEPLPVLELEIPWTQPSPPAHVAQKPQRGPAPPMTDRISVNTTISKDKPSSKGLSTSKPKASTPSTSHGKRDLLSYFSKPTSSSRSTLSASSKGKGRAIDEPLFREQDDARVIVDLTRSSSASGEGVRKRKTVGSPSPPVVPLSASKRNVVEGVRSGNKKVTAGTREPFLRAAARKKEAQRQESRAGIVTIEIPTLDESSNTDASVVKRKRQHHSVEDKEEEAHEGSEMSSPPSVHPATATARVMLPPAPREASIFTSSKRAGKSSTSSRIAQTTPSPSKGGWQGISSWYTTRDAFKPTPDNRTGRNDAQRQRAMEKAKNKQKQEQPRM